MPTSNPVTRSSTTIPRQSAAERRAAQIAGLATQQQDLKREAAERRLAREAREDPPAFRARGRRSTT